MAACCLSKTCWLCMSWPGHSWKRVKFSPNIKLGLKQHKHQNSVKDKQYNILNTLENDFLSGFHPTNMKLSDIFETRSKTANHHKVNLLVTKQESSLFKLASLGTITVAVLQIGFLVRNGEATVDYSQRLQAAITMRYDKACGFIMHVDNVCVITGTSTAGEQKFCTAKVPKSLLQVVTQIKVTLNFP